MLKKRVLAMGLVLALLCGFGAETSAADLESVVSPLVTEDLSAYENGEVLVCYQDGAFEVLTYGDDESLAAGLTALAGDETVTLVQPNYSYTSTALSTSDPLVSLQWALSNDGSFQMEDRQNQYPVYDDPFETPSLPGRWIAPGDFGIPGGFSRRSYSGKSTTTTTAVSGIDIGLEEAWAAYDGGSRDVVIALIDTGVDNTHQDLQNALWTNTDEIAGNGIDDDGNGYIDDVNGWNFYDNSNKIYTSSSDDSHGTHAAGTIAATGNNGVGITGIVQSDHVKIMVLKALGGSDGSGTTEAIIKAIQYAEANGASICNLSLGSSTNDRALYQAMANSSMLFVAAAGNDGENTDKTPSYPASYALDNIISVANLNYDGTLHYSSNYGATSVDLAAPGSYILSTTPDNNYSYMTGTSMAAPMVTAAAAMLYSYRSDITLADVKTILLVSVKKLDSLSGNTATGGMLDLGAAMTYNVSGQSGATWSEPEPFDSGSAPEIAVSEKASGSRTYLTVTVTDADNDLAYTAYAVGALTAEQFQSGSAGRSFTVGKNGTATFSVTSGTYTFYALDNAGNETVKSVTVTAATPTTTPSTPTTTTPSTPTTTAPSTPTTTTPSPSTPSQQPSTPSTTPSMPGRDIGSWLGFPLSGLLRGFLGW
jgi:subtilisin family serine protease